MTDVPDITRTPMTDASVAVTRAEAAADNAQTEVDMASSRGREDMLVALTRIRTTIAVMGRVFSAYQVEHEELLNEIDRLNAELLALHDPRTG